VVEVVPSVIGSVTVTKVVATLDGEIAPSTLVADEATVLLLEVVIAALESDIDNAPVLSEAPPLEVKVSVLVGVIVT